MKGWADMLLLSIIALLTFLLFFALVMKADSLETRTTQRQAEIMATKGAYELLLSSLGATWHQVGADAVLNASSQRFGLPLYWYRYNISAPALPAVSRLPNLGEGCVAGMTYPAVISANPAICWPDTKLVNNVLTAILRSVTLPSSFGITINMGSISNAVQTVTLATTTNNITLAADAARGSVQHDVRMTGGATSVEASPTISIDVRTQLNALVAASQVAVSSASTTHLLIGLSLILSGDLWRTNIRTTPQSSLDGNMQGLLSNMRARLNDITLSADAHVLTQWNFTKPTLRLEYDTGISLTEGLQAQTTTLANCTQTDEWQSKEFLYNRFAGAIEAAMPDLLNDYVNGRALLAAMAEADNWDPTLPGGLFGGGQTDAASDAIKTVEKLLNILKTGVDLESALELYYGGAIAHAWSTSVQSLYNDWKTNCDFGHTTGLLRLPLNRSTPDALKIVGCFGDRRCSGGNAATALGEEFYNGIDILANEGESVYAVESGYVIRTYANCAVPDCPSELGLYGIGNYVIIRHTDADGNNYYSVYGHLRNVDVTSPFVRAGERIGTAGKTGNTTTPLLHVRIAKEWPPKHYVNPCLYLGCMPATPQAVTGFGAESIPKPIVFASPQDYAIWLTQKDSAIVTLGDDFCSPADRSYRSSGLGYGFYSSQDPSFNVWSAFDGTVIAIRDDESGCGKAVYVDSGDFVTVYGGIYTTAIIGDKVGPWEGIGTVAAAPDTRCPSPHLSVVFAMPNFTIPSTYRDRCGRFTCAIGFVVPTSRCDVGRDCVTLPEVEGVPHFNISAYGVTADQYCAAVEWPVRRDASGWLWERTATGFERSPTELGFRIADSFGVLDCSQYDKKRFTWLNPKDLLCYNNTLWSCGSRIDVRGASFASSNDCIGGTGSECTSGYKCVEMAVTGTPPPGPTDAERVLKGRTISKFCGSPAQDTGINDTAQDWLCCAGQGGITNCKVWDFDGKELTCRDAATCTIIR